MRIFICDDEPIYVEYITNKIKQYTPANIPISITSSSIQEEIISIIEQKSFDLAFLDIEFDSVNGIQLGHKIKKRNPYCLIIFVSNYSQYVTDAFSLQVYQYILKPINEERFIYEYKKAINSFLLLERACVFNTNEGKITIHPRHIMYIETYYHKISIVTPNRTYYSNIKNKSQIKETLLHHDFLQSHQSYLVNMHYIQIIHTDYLVLNNQEQLPISILRKNEIIKQFHQFLINQFQGYSL